MTPACAHATIVYDRAVATAKANAADHAGGLQRDESSAGPPVLTIAGAGAGGALLLCCVGLALYLAYCRKTNGKQSAGHAEFANPLAEAQSTHKNGAYNPGEFDA